MRRSIEFATRAALVGLEAYSLLNTACASQGQPEIPSSNKPAASSPAPTPGIGLSQLGVMDQAPVSGSRKRGIALESLDFMQGFTTALTPGGQHTGGRISVENSTSLTLRLNPDQLDSLPKQCSAESLGKVLVRFIQVGPSAKRDSEGKPFSLNFIFIPGLTIFTVNIDDTPFYLAREINKYAIDPNRRLTARANLTNLILQDLVVTGLCGTTDFKKVRPSEPPTITSNAVRDAVKFREEVLAGRSQPAIALAMVGSQ